MQSLPWSVGLFSDGAGRSSKDILLFLGCEVVSSLLLFPLLFPLICAATAMCHTLALSDSPRGGIRGESLILGPRGPEGRKRDDLNCLFMRS